MHLPLSLCRRHGLTLLLFATAATLSIQAQMPASPAGAATSRDAPPAPLPASPRVYRQFAQQTESMLRQDVLGHWYPASVDQVHGGFHANFDRQWRPTPDQGKFSVFQARMTWTAATVARRRPDLRPQYLPFVQHGVAYLRGTLWDKEYGGFFWGLAEDGKPGAVYGDGKHMYGISFCVYALAAAYKTDPNPATLTSAQEAFHWIEQHAHDDVHGGYYEWLSREGKPLVVPAYISELTFQYGADSPVGYKSMNTHIHLLEAYTELYSVWKDDRLRQRVVELLGLVRDRITVQPGAMNLYFTPDWRPIPDHDSYGHDVETAFLLQEAADELGQADDQTTRQTGRMMVDHALRYGFNEREGGLAESGAAFGKPTDLRQEWWVQMEDLNALLLMHELYGRETDRYWVAFQRQWQQIRRVQVDPQYGGEYNMVQGEGTPAFTQKGSPWKAAYHESRALLNVTDRLEALAGGEKP